MITLIFSAIRIDCMSTQMRWNKFESLSQETFRFDSIILVQSNKFNFFYLVKRKEKVKRKSATLGLRVETCLCYTVVYMGVCVCMFRKFLRCKFFIRLCAPHRHTSHFCLYKHQSCGYVNHHRIGYKQSTQSKIKT